MRSSLLYLGLLLALIALVTQRQDPPEVKIQPDQTYAVYSALINSLNLDKICIGNETDGGAVPNPQVRTIESMRPGSPAHRQAERRLGYLHAVEELHPLTETLKDFEVKNRGAHPLVDHFGLAKHYEVLPQKQFLAALYDRAADRRSRAKCLILSAVGFNRDQTQAMVTLLIVEAPARSGFLFTRDSRGQWKQTRASHVWVANDFGESDSPSGSQLALDSQKTLQHEVILE